MQKVALWSGIAIAVIVGLAIYAAFQFGEQSPLIAAGNVALSSELTEDAKGVRTLYITVFDATSPAPMPYGAMRETLDFDPEGKFFDFVLTKERLQVMNPAAPYPETMRIKARLDKDGMGGQDQPGDLTGEVTGVAIGSESVAIKIESRVE